MGTWPSVTGVLTLGQILLNSNRIMAWPFAIVGISPAPCWNLVSKISRIYILIVDELYKCILPV